MKIVDFFIEVLVASILYILAPSSFDVIISVAFVLLYVFQLIKLFHYQRTDKSWLSFNTLFFVMLTMVTYLMPFLYIIGSDSQIFTIIVYDESYIYKSLFLTSIAVACYKVGYYRGESKRVKPSTAISEKYLPGILRVNNILVIVSVFIFWGTYTVAMAGGKKDISGLVVTLINCIFIFAIIFSGFSNTKYRLQLMSFLVRHRLLYLCTFFIVVSMLVMGDRYTPICLAVTVLFVVNRFVHKFSAFEFIALVAAGFIVLVGVSLTRNVDKGGKSSALQQENYVVYFQDIVPINLDFYLGLEWKDKYGYFKPGRIAQIVAHPIPFLPAVITNTFFDGNVSSGLELTEYNRVQTNTKDESGIGTHAIVDVYMSWGVLGVIILFYLFGLLVGSSSRRSNNIYYLIIYGCFVSRAIYIPRETLFTPYRDIVYILLLALLVLPKQRSYE